jgi:hypothetical protein
MNNIEQLRLFDNHRLIISLYDFSTAWPSHYISAGYPVICWDYKIEGCILQHFDRLLSDIYDAIEAGMIPWGLLAAPPCTDISKAGAWTWPRKDAEMAPAPYAPWTQTEYSIALVEIVLHLVQLFPWKWWVIENPPGRMERLVPEMAFFRQMMFNPFEYGDAYTKKTVLWGSFNPNLPRKPVLPELVRIKGGGRYYYASPMWAKTGGKSERTKTIRSKTPAGFAKAFFEANN